ncbi:MFS transporter [Calidifontibacillus erzurumensis]|uniref:MFS transporter n=1 Tax=Calidifontibacillus erzurumensis TaxID=2741433 RepID=A0A8J8GE66_9BACI|nr:MFS transporter [Calidifontibacillus erzurumensis]NSL52215.1 MFS transporter [Calidifontibacillus erzurumensis]
MEAALNEQKQKEKLWTKNFILLFFSNLFLFFGFQMLLPTLPVYVNDLGGDDSAVGLVIGIFTISALFVRPFSGAAVDIFGRKLFLLLGLIICIVAIAMYGFVTTVLFVLLLRILHGIGWGVSTTTYGTVISDIIPSSRRGEGMGYYGMSTTLAMAVAPVTGIWMINHFGYNQLFISSFISTAIALALSQLIDVKKISTEQKGTKNFTSLLYEKSALLPSLLVFFMTFAYGGVVGFITLFGKEVGISNVGWFFSMNALILLLIRPISGKIYDSKGHPWVLVPGAVFGVVGLAILSYSTSLIGLTIAAVFFGIAFGSIQPALQALLIERSPIERRGAANATFFSAFDLGIGTGAMILGAIAGMTGYAMMYRLTSIVFILFLIIYCFYLLKKHI